MGHTFILWLHSILDGLRSVFASPDIIARFFGFLTGVSIALLLTTLWITFADAIFELITENTLDKLRGVEEGRPALNDLGAAVEVLVSDLHIDTWDYPASAGKRAQTFIDFLQEVRHSETVTGFILNGDLMDIPLFAGTTPESKDPLLLTLEKGALPLDGVLASRYDDILENLLALEEQKNGKSACVERAIFQTGNHDVGICGLRYTRQNMPTFLPQVRISWNPFILLKTPPQQDRDYAKPVYIEHGHHYDPFLWLYMRYAMVDILRGGPGGFEQNFLQGFQRKGRTGMGQSAQATDWGAVRGGRAETLSSEMSSPEVQVSIELDPLPAPDLNLESDWDFAKAPKPLQDWLVVLRFRWAARQIFRRARRRGFENVRTVTFGHTHVPDRYIFPGGKVYINSGDWCGKTTHQCYSLVYKDGTVRGPFQWENAGKFRQRVGFDQRSAETVENSK